MLVYSRRYPKYSKEQVLLRLLGFELVVCLPVGFKFFVVLQHSNEDDTPGMCLAVVVVAAMLVVGWGISKATVEEAAMGAAEEADDGPEIAPQNSETWIYKSTGHLASKKGFRQKRKVLLRFLRGLSHFFYRFLQKRNIVSLFSIPGSCGFRGIPGIPARMHNLAPLSVAMTTCAAPSTSLIETSCTLIGRTRNCELLDGQHMERRSVWHGERARLKRRLRITAISCNKACWFAASKLIADARSGLVIT